jgi:AAA family ATPase
LTAGLEAGQRARIFPFSGLASTKLCPGILSPRDLQEVGIIRLKELSIHNNTIKTNPSKTIKDLRSDWLTLAARELLGMFTINMCISVVLFSHRELVDLKYITNTQIIELNYEGNRRRFIVHSIMPRSSLHSNATEIEDKLSHDITALSLDKPKQLWSVTWDCIVRITSDDHTDGETASHKVFTHCICFRRSL